MRFRVGRRRELLRPEGEEADEKGRTSLAESLVEGLVLGESGPVLAVDVRREDGEGRVPCVDWLHRARVKIPCAELAAEACLRRSLLGGRRGRGLSLREDNLHSLGSVGNPLVVGLKVGVGVLSLARVERGGVDFLGLRPHFRLVKQLADEGVSRLPGVASARLSLREEVLHSFSAGEELSHRRAAAGCDGLVLRVELGQLHDLQLGTE